MRLFADHALLPSGLARDVLIEHAGGLVTAVVPDSAPGDAHRLPGVLLPGFANAHSHAFHRALRGRTAGGEPGAAGGGTFWSWRRGMYRVAARLDPDSYLLLARAVYAEMALAGITAVAEFHYLHHGPGGVPYDEPTLMSTVLAEAAADAGIRLTLLDTCYLAGGLDAGGHTPLDEVQRRFADPDAATWADRAASFRPPAGVLRGAAAHSVRAVPAAALAEVAAAAAGLPLHVHLSEQRAENEACLAFYGLTPTALLDSAGMLGPDTTVVHATHLEPADIAMLGTRGVHACFCPTTERDLADGIGPARALADAGARLSLGSDEQVVVDILEEARGLESHERLLTGRRGVFTAPELLAAATAHASLGRPSGGRIEVGAPADLVAVRLDTVRTAGTDPAQVLAAATAADVDTVLVGGRTVVENSQHLLGDVPRLLAEAIQRLWTAE